MFVYVAALPTHSSQGAYEVKNTMSMYGKEVQEGGKDRSTQENTTFY